MKLRTVEENQQELRIDKAIKTGSTVALMVFVSLFCFWTVKSTLYEQQLKELQNNPKAAGFHKLKEKKQKLEENRKKLSSSEVANVVKSIEEIDAKKAKEVSSIINSVIVKIDKQKVEVRKGLEAIDNKEEITEKEKILDRKSRGAMGQAFLAGVCAFIFYVVRKAMQNSIKAREDGFIIVARSR